jgi:hypothetical protein
VGKDTCGIDSFGLSCDTSGSVRVEGGLPTCGSSTGTVLECCGEEESTTMVTARVDSMKEFMESPGMVGLRVRSMVISWGKNPG